MNRDDNHNWTPQDELDWLAFRYVAEELSADEADAFERLLADDQSARDAVSRAVQTTRAVASLGAADFEAATQPAGVGRATRQQVWAWIGVGTVAVAVCLAVWLGGINHAPTPTDRTDDGFAQRDVPSPEAGGNENEHDLGAKELGAVMTAYMALDAIDESESPSSDELSRLLAGAELTDADAADPDEFDEDGSEEGQFDWMVAALHDAALNDSEPARNEEQN
jgi:hypothetical protein